MNKLLVWVDDVSLVATVSFQIKQNLNRMPHLRGWRNAFGTFPHRCIAPYIW